MASDPGAIPLHTPAPCSGSQGPEAEQGTHGTETVQIPGPSEPGEEALAGAH